MPSRTTGVRSRGTPSDHASQGLEGVLRFRPAEDSRLGTAECASVALHSCVWIDTFLQLPRHYHQNLSPRGKPASHLSGPIFFVQLFPPVLRGVSCPH